MILWRRSLLPHVSLCLIEDNITRQRWSTFNYSHDTKILWKHFYSSVCVCVPLSQALASNPKIDVREGKYAFKPKYHLKDKKALIRLLDKHDTQGLGGVLLDDVEEGLPNSAKAIKVQTLFFSFPCSTKNIM